MVLAVLAAGGLCVFAARAGATVLLDPEIKQVLCAERKIQLFYYYLELNRDPEVINAKVECNGEERTVAMPNWMDEEVKAMSGRKVWREPAEGELSEAALWQTPVALLYSFTDVTKKTFPRDKKGDAIIPSKLIKEYADINVRYQLALDRIYRARLFSSFGGRGRSILATFDLISKEMESLSDALSSNDSDRYAASVTAISVLTQDAFSELFRVPRQAQEEGKGDSSSIMGYLLTIIGMIVVFGGAFLYMQKERERMRDYVDHYIQRSKEWTDDFNRQFLQVKVQYLALVPAGIFVLLGLLTFNLIALVLFTIIGIYVGLHMPSWTLNFLKARRGKKIDAQLMDALILLSNSLKSGMDIVQGFELVSKDLTPPISDEFGLVIKNYQLGTSFEAALAGMEERVSSRMLTYMVKAIVLQRQVGGNLTKIFARIVENIREESKLDDKIKSLTAQQKIQSIVVGIMPWIMVGVMFMFQPETMIRFYTSAIGVAVLVFAMTWIGIGMKVVAKLGEIKV